MKKLKIKDITEAYNRLKAKPRDSFRNKMIEQVALDLMFAAQDSKNN